MNESILDKVIATQGQSSQSDSMWSDFLALFSTILSTKERSMICMRFGIEGHEEKTLEQIGEVYHLTRERVRQIVKHSIKSLQQSLLNEEAYGRVVRAVVVQLERVGGLITHDRMVNGLVHESNYQPLALFTIQELGVEGVERVEEHPRFRRCWKLSRVSFDSFEKLSELIEASLASGPKSEDELYELFHTREEFRYIVSLSLDQGAEREIFKNILELSKRINGNVMGLWGLSDDPLVTPRRVGDKIFLILKQHGKPMHFRDITEAINKMKFDGKRAYLPTIHNELILDTRFVLVGRGTYALTEWGYVRGVVADVIEQLLKERGPLTREEIEQGVMRQRIVKPGTIYLSLMNKKRFMKDKETGKYDLVSKGTETISVLPGIGKAADPASD